MVKSVVIGFDGRTMGSQRTGVGFYSYNLAKELSKLLPEPLYIWSSWSALPEASLTSNVHRMDALPQTSTSVFRFLWEHLAYPHKINKTPVDIMHFPAFVVPLWRLDCPAVVTIHDLCIYRYPEFFSKFQQLNFRYILPKTVKRAERIIADSKSTKRDIIQFLNVDEDIIDVIYPAVDERFVGELSDSQRRNVIDKYDLPETYVLFTGTLEPRKNLINLLRAFEIVVQKVDIDVQLLIIGRRGWLFDQTLEYARNSVCRERIRFLGYVDDEDMPYLYSLSTVFVYPSLYEGFGLPVLEAMSLGVPVITSNVSSLPEVAGDAALLVDPLDFKELAKTMVTVITDAYLRSFLSERGRTQAKKFSWSETAREIIACYNKAMRKDIKHEDLHRR